MTKGNEFICSNTNYEDGALRQEYSDLVQEEYEGLPKQFQRSACDPSAKALWEEIGEDLNSSSEDRSRTAAATACYTLAKLGGNLMGMVYERETHQEGWRHEQGGDQRFGNEGLDYASQVFTELVKQNNQVHSDVNLASLYALNLPERYYSTALAYGFTQPWFDLIDKDFSNSSQGVREIAWTAFNFSYISNREQEMDREGIQDVYVRCYEKLVIEGVFTQSRKHKNNARGYFKYALYYAKYNKDTRHHDPLLLNDEEWENDFLTESAENDALRNMREGILHDELVKPSHLTEREYQYFYAVYVDSQEIKDLSKQYGVTSSAISTAFSEAHRRLILLRDACIAAKLSQWRTHVYPCVHHTPTIDFTDHPDEFTLRVENAMKQALKAASCLDNSRQVFLPLTSGIDERPGRLYLFTGNHEEAQARATDYLKAHHIDPGQYWLSTRESFTPGRNFRDYLTGFPILDEIIRRIKELDNSTLGTTPIHLGVLLAKNNKKAPVTAQKGHHSRERKKYDFFTYFVGPNAHITQKDAFGCYCAFIDKSPPEKRPPSFQPNFGYSRWPGDFPVDYEMARGCVIM